MDQNPNNNLFEETPPPNNTPNQGSGPQVYQIPVGEPYTPPPPPPQPKSNKMIWIIVGIVVAIFLCCCCLTAGLLWVFGDAIVEEIERQTLTPLLSLMF